MSKVTKKAPTDRKVCYVPFKSYHINSPKSKVQVKDEPSKLSSTEENHKSKKTRKRVHSIARSAADKRKGDNEENANRLQEAIAQAALKEAELKTALEDLRTLQTENESLKQSLDAAIPLDSHEQIKSLLDESERKLAQLQNELEEAQAKERSLTDRWRELEQKLEDTNRENAELFDRAELLADKAAYWGKQNDDKLSQIRELETTIAALHGELESLASKNQVLCGENDQLESTLKEFHTKFEEQNGKLEKYENIKRRLKLKEMELRKAIDEMEVKSKFVEVMENERLDLKKLGGTLNEQNARLTNDLTEMKKRLEQLRQKYDEINKENKLLKEKEARYLIHERFSVGKYTSKIPEPGRQSRAANSSQTRQPPNPTVTVNTNPFQDGVLNERMYNLLHRQDDDQRQRLSKIKFRK